jgi:hypothetical protein
MVELHRDPELYMCSLQRTFRDITGRRTFLPHEQRLIDEGFGSNVPTFGPCVLGRHDKNELIAHAGGKTLLPRSQRMAADDPKIELTFPDASLDGPRISDLKLYIHAGIFGPKRCNDSGQYVQPRSRTGADQERPVSQTIQVGERLACALNRDDGTLRKLLEDTASLSNSARASPSVTPWVSSSSSFWLVRSDAGILVGTGMPPLAAGANRRRLGFRFQARVHPRLVFQQV